MPSHGEVCAIATSDGEPHARPTNLLSGNFGPGVNGPLLIAILLVAALMTLLGKANWYLPGWVDRLLPRISIEGAEYFQARDAREAAGQLHAAHPVQYAEAGASQRE